MNEVEKMIERVLGVIADIHRRLDIIEKYANELEQTQLISKRLQQGQSL